MSNQGIIEKQNLCDDLLKKMNIQINKQLINDQIPTNMSGDQISVLFSEKQEREGLNVDYQYLKTGEVLEIISHYVSN